MIQSMTGYGRAQAMINGRDISVEIRSVNHRYFELAVRIPRAFSYLEEKIKACIQSQISRGKIEVTLAIQNIEGSDTQIELNMELAKSYAEAISRMARELDMPSEASASTIAKFPDVFTVRRVVPDEEELWIDVQRVLNDALAAFCDMRRIEGARLKQDIAERIAAVAARVGEIEAQALGRLEHYRERLFARMQAVLDNADIDESRILLEAALYADKSAIDEETVRLRSHLAQFDKIVASGVPIGRKLDFLVQEINREVNTIGSKANDLEITTAVVDIKAEIEKVREQIQNIE